RGGKVAAQDRAVRETDSEIVAFSDANATWSEDALRKLVRAFADPDVAYVCGQLKILAADGSNKEGVYWRYEMVQRGAESTLGSGLLHVVLLATSLVLVTNGWVYDVVLGAQALLLVAAAAGVGIARYYVLVSWATLVALWNYLRRGVPATWQPVHE